MTYFLEKLHKKYYTLTDAIEPTRKPYHNKSPPSIYLSGRSTTYLNRLMLKTA
jgi:hypothetical protein